MHNCVIGADVTIEKGAVVRDSIIMNQTQIGENCVLEKAIVAENVSIGKNTAISGVTEREDYPDGILASGEVIIKAGDRK